MIHSVDTYSRKLNLEHQITAPQLFCLHTIVQNKSLNLTDLAERVNLSPSTVNGILDRLEAKQLVRRERSDKDRRKVRACPTERGERLAAEAPLPLQDELAKAIKRLPEAEKAAIALSLERVVEMMGAGSVEPAPLLENIPVLTQ